jgi:hypothetical protein
MRSAVAAARVQGGGRVQVVLRSVCRGSAGWPAARRVFVVALDVVDEDVLLETFGDVILS